VVGAFQFRLMMSDEVVVVWVVWVDVVPELLESEPILQALSIEARVMIAKILVSLCIVIDTAINEFMGTYIGKEPSLPTVIKLAVYRTLREKHA
jgi:hypothetical protein